MDPASAVKASAANVGREVWLRDFGGQADQLKSDEVRVRFEDWEIKLGDSIPAKFEEGLEHSRVLVLCLSAQALAADPGASGLESHTFRFTDPLNHDGRFIPLRLDDAPIKGSLAQFLPFNWRKTNASRRIRRC